MTTLYGIKNCDTIKKARKWLEDNNVEYQFHDYRVDGLSDELLASFVKRSDWSSLLNKRSTTYRNLPDEVKNNLTDNIAYTQVMEQPTLLKRPILVAKDRFEVGFKAAQYQEIFS